MFWYKNYGIAHAVRKARKIKISTFFPTIFGQKNFPKHLPQLETLAE
jgi:hypothetical protein